MVVTDKFHCNYIIHVLLHPTDIQLVTKLARETGTSVFFYRDKWQKSVLHTRLNPMALSQCAEVSHRCTYKTSSMRHTNSIPAGISLHVPWNTLSICLSAISLKHSIRLPWCLRPLHGYNLYSTPSNGALSFVTQTKSSESGSDFNYKMTHLPWYVSWSHPIFKVEFHTGVIFWSRKGQEYNTHQNTCVFLTISMTLLVTYINDHFYIAYYLPTTVLRSLTEQNEHNVVHGSMLSIYIANHILYQHILLALLSPINLLHENKYLGPKVRLLFPSSWILKLCAQA